MSIKINAGHRLTKVRQALIDVFAIRTHPLSVADIGSILKERGLEPHKVTLYRELEFLKTNQVIQGVNLADGVQRFESLDAPHHHHLVCVSCDAVEDVELKDDDRWLEAKIVSKTNFEIIRHNLEFFGFCGNCKSV